jgi:hypothetical protein
MAHPSVLSFKRDELLQLLVALRTHIRNMEKQSDADPEWIGSSKNALQKMEEQAELRGL